MRTLILALFALLASAPARAQSQPFIVRILPSGEDIAVAGSFTDGLGEAFRAVLLRAPKARLVRLESTGGRFDIAIDLYIAIRLRGLDTAVQGTCASACTIAFMAGSRRHAGPAAKLGFHRAASPKEAAFPMVDYMIRGLYLHAGMAESFAERALSTPHAGMWWPKLEEMRRAGVVTDIGIPP